MKKTSLVLVLCSLFFAFGLTYAYTTEDVERANLLASDDIIVDQSKTPEKYRLDEFISRQEVVGMALKIKGVAFPLTYNCKGYFTDAVFPQGHVDSWVCRAVEFAADRGLLTRQLTKTRPKDMITKAEALALIWKGAEMTIDSNQGESEGIFYDNKGKKAEIWQQNLLHTARKRGVIDLRLEQGQKYLWDHNKPATRNEIFSLISVIYGMNKASKQSLYLNFSGEVQMIPKSISVLSSDAKTVQQLQEKKFTEVVKTLSLEPLATRTEGHTLFILQDSPDYWGHVNYSTIVTYFGKIFQIISPYNPYEKALSAMLKKFNLASEKEFYELPYGDHWESTRDFIDEFYKEELKKTPLVQPTI